MRVWVLGIFLLLSLNQGVVAALGLPLSLVHFAVDVSIIALLVATVVRVPECDFQSCCKYLALPLLATGIGLGSSWYQHSDPLEVLLFLREMLMPLMYFALLLLAPLKPHEWKVLTRLIFIIFAIQISIAALKYWAIGSNEKIWVGTFHQSAGQLGLLMPMTAVALIWAYAIKRQRLLLPCILITCFALVSVVNEKRSVILSLPLLMFFGVGVDFIASKMAPLKQADLWYLKPDGILRLLLASTVSFGIVTLCALQAIPSFNIHTRDYDGLPTRTVAAYIVEYLTRDYSSDMNFSKNPNVHENRNIQMGRLRLWQAGVEQCLRSPATLCIFGSGGGKFLEHPELIEKPDDFLYQKFQLRGPVSTGLRHFFEFGAAGFLLMILWFLQIGSGLIGRLSHRRYGTLVLGGLGIWVLLLFDYAIYSQVGWSAGVFIPICFLVVARSLRLDGSLN